MPCRRLLQALSGSGVDTGLVREVEGPTGTAVILLEEDGGWVGGRPAIVDCSL